MVPNSSTRDPKAPPSLTPAERRAKHKKWRRKAMWIVEAVCLLFTIIFFSVTCTTTPAGQRNVCSGQYFSFSGNFTIFGEVRTDSTEFAGFTAAFFIAQFLYWMTAFFQYPFIGSAIYTEEGMEDASEEPGFTIGVGFMYAVNYSTFILFTAMGSTSNIWFFLSQAAGAMTAYLVGSAIFVSPLEKVS